MAQRVWHGDRYSDRESNRMSEQYSDRKEAMQGHLGAPGGALVAPRVCHSDRVHDRYSDGKIDRVSDRRRGRTRYSDTVTQLAAHLFTAGEAWEHPAVHLWPTGSSFHHDRGGSWNTCSAQTSLQEYSVTEHSDTGRNVRKKKHWYHDTEAVLCSVGGHANCYSNRSCLAARVTVCVTDTVTVHLQTG